MKRCDIFPQKEFKRRGQPRCMTNSRPQRSPEFRLWRNSLVAWPNSLVYRYNWKRKLLIQEPRGVQPMPWFAAIQTAPAPVGILRV